MGNEEKIIRGIIQAMSTTKKDIYDDFKCSISECNSNGIYSNVWARRSEILKNYFLKYENVEVWHIQRSKLWQIDPIFDKSTGTLYLMFSNENFLSIKNKYLIEHDSHHYSFSFLLQNNNLSSLEGEQLSFFVDDIENQNIRRKKDLIKMIGENSNNIRRVKFVIVTYHKGEAVLASLEEYTSLFELSSKLNISSYIDTHYMGDSYVIDSVNNNNKQVTQNLVKLKKNFQKNERY